MLPSPTQKTDRPSVVPRLLWRGLLFARGFGITYSMAKPKSYDVPNPDAERPETKPEQQVRQEREKRLRAAMFAHLPGSERRRQETMRRGGVIASAKHKGSRGDRQRRAVQEASD